jgi:hypothetical protein
MKWRRIGDLTERKKRTKRKGSWAKFYREQE